MNDPARARVRRADVVRRQQEENRQERIARIRKIQEPELARDYAALNQVIGPGPQFQGPTWFHSDYVDGSRNYVLETIGRIFTNSLDKKIIKEITDRVFDFAWLGQRYYGHEGDKPNFGTSHDTDPDCSVFMLKLMAEDYPWSPDSSPHANDRSWGHIRGAVNLVQCLRLLRRFSDSRYPATSQYPLPDGSNLASNVLKVSWVLHRAWIRALHYRSLKFGNDEYGWDQIKQILKLSLAFHQAEMEEAPWDLEQDQQLPHRYGVLRHLYSSVSNALRAAAFEVFTETRQQNPVRSFTTEETVNYNLTPQGLAANISRHFGPLGYQWILLSSLLSKADELEERLDEEHVEDVLINKRVVFDDERWEIYNELRNEGYDPAKGFDIPMFAGSGRQITLEPYLRKISQVNRRRRNYLLLRDWSKRRPWKQLYIVYNTAGGEQDYLRESIMDFHAKIDELKQIERENGFEGDRNPSLLANIWSCLFPIHPIASHGIMPPSDQDPCDGPNNNTTRAGTAVAPLFRPKFFDDGCVICQEAFDGNPGGVIAQLHCGHLFHFTCIRDSWDTHEIYRSLCAHCRSTGAEWYLHEQVAIYPEEIDVWDNRIVGEVDAVLKRNNIPSAEELAKMSEHEKTMMERFQNPDLMEDMYGKNEAEDISASFNWHIHPLGGMSVPRVAKVEMVHLRRRRRAQNEWRREKIKEAGTGIAGLDPAVR